MRFQSETSGFKSGFKCGRDLSCKPFKIALPTFQRIALPG